jgi:C-3',4' desaturase CrtD
MHKMVSQMDADVIVIGAGISGMAVAARLQARGLSTLVLEAHSRAGGCAGYFRRRGFAFDVGATTLVDFGPGGAGDQLLQEIGLPPFPAEALPGYRAWLPDRIVDLHRDPARWARERLAVLGDTPAHRRFWALLDALSDAFWAASRRGLRLPVRSLYDAAAAVSACVRSATHPSTALALAAAPLLLHWSVADALRVCGLEYERPLRGLLGMLLQDTVHATIDDAPLINGALGVTIRGAGLTRALGGMYGFWRAFLARYHALGGVLRVATRVDRVVRETGGYAVYTQRGGVFRASQVVSSLPAWNTAQIAPDEVAHGLRPYLARDECALGGAVAVFLGVPEDEVVGHPFTHHQLMYDYETPLGDGNNMFISISAPGDALSAPPCWRAVMLSTHTELDGWLVGSDYTKAREHIAQTLITQARRVYPDLGAHAQVLEIGTPRTYARYTGRYRGAVGGVRQNLANSNQHAIPCETALPGFWLAGDTTWPGLGTVACTLSSRIVADEAQALARRLAHALALNQENTEIAG